MIEQLNKQFSPKNYNLSLDIDSQNLKFSGNVTIQGNALNLTKQLKFHSKDLEITSCTINTEPTNFTLDPKNDCLSLGYNATSLDEVEVYIEFNGKITDDMVGMYPCYFEDQGNKKWLIATQFESHYARQVFPCIDEPAAKATFDLTLKTNVGETVLSNMPIKSQTSDESKLVTTFETTPKMSTYLLAFVTGEMHSIEAKTKDGVIVKTWSTVAQPLEQLEFANKEAVDIIEYFDDYFGTAYPLPKCDQVALPDFDAGAMENWGLVTYRESVLLVDQNNRSVSSEQYCSIVVAHELSHQWFGNLVTMQWWDDLWLNESFASIMEYIAVDSLHPQWQIWEEYTSTDAVMASNRDVYLDVQPVRVDVNDPAEISSLFDGAIVYAKGGRLLKMLREYIGDKAFRNSLKKYFAKHAYGNTTRNDLWQTMSEASGLEIVKIMESWLEQSGLPLIRLVQSGNVLTVTQQRLLLNDGDENQQIWQVPLLSQSHIDPNVLNTKQMNLKSEASDAVFLNQFGSGHFVTQYQSNEQLTSLQTAMRELKIPAEGRINSLNDMILLSKAGETSLTSALTLLSELKGEPRDGVWSMIAATIGNAKVLIEGNKTAEAKLKKFTFELVNDLYKKLGWHFSDIEDSNTRQLRRSILSLALGSENQQVIEAALEQFKAMPPDQLPAEIRAMLMGAAVRFGDSGVIEHLIQLNKVTQSPDLKSDICVALTSTKDPDIAKKLTKLIKDSSHVRPQDIIRWCAYLLRNQDTRQTMWNWLKQNWNWIMKTFESSKSYDYFPRYAANSMNSKQWLSEYKDFFEPMLENLALQRTIKVGITEIEARIAWRSRDEIKIIEWLEATVK